MAGASVESCRFVVLRFPRGRLGSVLDVRKRLHRTRGGFRRCIHISKVLCTINSMFLRAESFNQPLNNWNVSNVTYMNNMFAGANSFNQPLHAPWYHEGSESPISSESE